jgi:peptidoglycan/xylan/chitin deacetylase (PgdA/CDA1 family)
LGRTFNQQAAAAFQIAAVVSRRMGVNPRPVLRRAGVTRKRVASLRMCCERYTLGYLGERQPARSRILCYHSVGTPEWGVNDVRPARFRRQLESAMELGYRFVPAELLANDPRDEPRLAITFDDGLASVARNAAPILKEMGIPWTLFVVTDWADGEHGWDADAMLGWGEIEQLASAGVTIGSHSVTHPDFGRINTGQVEQELNESRLTMASRIGITPTSFAIPLGQSKNWTDEADLAARRAGYLTIYAQSEDHRHPGTVGRTFVTRFDRGGIFKGALDGVFDRWEEWL